MQRVGADTLDRVAAAHVRDSGAFLGRRATAAAVVQSTLVCLQRELAYCHGRPRIASFSSQLHLLRGLPTTMLQLLML